MKKVINLIIIIDFLIFLLFYCLFFKLPINYSIQEDNWNNGYCELDGERLYYIGTNNKELYECKKCGKIYKFNKVMSYKGD